MTPRRHIIIGILPKGSIEITEYYWNGKMVVYINHKKSNKTYEEAIKKFSSKE